MAPLSEAIKTKLSFVKGDGTAVYKGVCDPEWSISVPHGGYILSTVMDALLQHQSSTHHKDPAHITAQFLVGSLIRFSTFSSQFLAHDIILSSTISIIYFTIRSSY
jgi:hypothetical protein